jgi:hypothetical protein
MPRKATPKPEVSADAAAPEKKPARRKAPAATHKPATPRKPRAMKATSYASAPFDADSHRQAIERQAYFNWIERGCVHGDPAADWLRAEEEVRQRYLRSTASTRP